MGKICLLCNSIEVIDIPCPCCGTTLCDGGALESYYGPYSPYMDDESFNYCQDMDFCVHLLYCPVCHYDVRSDRELFDM